MWEFSHSSLLDVVRLKKTVDKMAFMVYNINVIKRKKRGIKNEKDLSCMGFV